jgi:hydrogenase maturation protease
MKSPEIDADEQLLVIAYGNTLRRDDGAGIGLAGILVARWRALGVGVRYIVVPQLAPELAIDIADPEVGAVVFVDTARTECYTTIQVQRVQPQLATPALGHYLDPATLLVYTALLYQHRPPAWLVTVPGTDFEHGEGFSSTVRRLLATAPALANPLLEQIREHKTCMNLPLPKV